RARDGEGGPARGRVVDVGLQHGGAARARLRRPTPRADEGEDLHPRVLAAQQLEQVAAHEAVGARDEDPHFSAATSAPLVVALVVITAGRLGLLEVTTHYLCLPILTTEHGAAGIR